MAMSPVGREIKSHCAGEDQQQCSWLSGCCTAAESTKDKMHFLADTKMGEAVRVVPSVDTS
jgi:hypothetical protein